MSRVHYDPDVAPDADEWLALSEQERIRLIEDYHAPIRPKAPNMKAHASFHAAVEAQIANAYGPSIRAIERLQNEGLSRHESIHAIAFVIIEFVQELYRGQTEAERLSYPSRFATAIEVLSAKSWLAEAEGD
jgi:hypothetical protein